MQAGEDGCRKNNKLRLLAGEHFNHRPTGTRLLLLECYKLLVRNNATQPEGQEKHYPMIRLLLLALLESIVGSSNSPQPVHLQA